MKSILTSLFLCSIFLSACSNNIATLLPVYENRSLQSLIKEEIPDDFIPKTLNITSLGDSLTKGVGDSTNRGGYLPYLEERLEKEKGIKDVVFHNFGVSGNRTSQILERLRLKEINDSIGSSDIVILTAGGNDVMKVVKENFFSLEIQDFEKEKKQYEKNLTSIIDGVKNINPEAMIILIGLYNPFFDYFSDIREMDMIMESWNEVSQTVLSKYENAYFSSVSQPFKEAEENLFYKDYFHPNDKGYELMAKEVFSVLHGKALETLYAQDFGGSSEEKTNHE